MKDLKNVSLPDDLRYTRDHEWAKPEGDTIRVGITDYAQDQLGDIVFVELPEIGLKLEKEDEFGTIESVKAVAEVYMPISGEITGVNAQLEDRPEQVNSEPYQAWIVEVAPSDPDQMNELMDRDRYLKMLSE